MICGVENNEMFFSSMSLCTEYRCYCLDIVIERWILNFSDPWLINRKFGM